MEKQSRPEFPLPDNIIMLEPEASGQDGVRSFLGEYAGTQAADFLSEEEEKRILIVHIGKATALGVQNSMSVAAIRGGEEPRGLISHSGSNFFDRDLEAISGHVAGNAHVVMVAGFGPLFDVDEEAVRQWESAYARFVDIARTNPECHVLLLRLTKTSQQVSLGIDVEQKKIDYIVTSGTNPPDTTV